MIERGERVRRKSCVVLLCRLLCRLKNTIVRVRGIVVVRTKHSLQCSVIPSLDAFGACLMFHSAFFGCCDPVHTIHVIEMTPPHHSIILQREIFVLVIRFFRLLRACVCRGMRQIIVNFVASEQSCYLPQGGSIAVHFFEKKITVCIRSTFMYV